MSSSPPPRRSSKLHPTRSPPQISAGISASTAAHAVSPFSTLTPFSAHSARLPRMLTPLAPTTSSASSATGALVAVTGAEPSSPSKKRKMMDSNSAAPSGSILGSFDNTNDYTQQIGAGAPASGGEDTQNAADDAGLDQPPSKKPRTNIPWSADEERRLKVMRDENKTWSEIAKTFPNRTEGSVKKHWYKDMHYADFAEEEKQALLQAIKDYDANKWKVIGQKLSKPAKACEQYAKEHFAGRI